MMHFFLVLVFVFLYSDLDCKFLSFSIIFGEKSTNSHVDFMLIIYYFQLILHSMFYAVLAVLLF